MGENTDKRIDDVEIDSCAVETTPSDEDTYFKYLKTSLDDICSEIARRFDFCLPNSKPRMAAIIDILASSPRIVRIVEKLQQKQRPDIDAVFLENHRLAVGILVERLQNFLQERGYRVSVLTDAKLKHGTIDVLVAPTSYGINLRHNGRQIVVEVKTGKSLSYSQLFRYLLDESNATLVLWRIKTRQVVVLRRKSLQPVLQAFMEMCVLRGKRVLATKRVKYPNSAVPRNFTLSSRGFEITVNNFAEGLMETLPVVLETVLLEIKSNSDRA